MSRTIESQMSLMEARGRILAHAEPGAAVAVSLGEAIGLVLAEAVVADVDQPPFDRVTRDGYAVHAAEAVPGTLLRVVTPRRSRLAGDAGIEAGEAARVRPGDPLPFGADAVLSIAQVRPDPDTGPVRVVEVLRPAVPGRAVTPRGSHLAAGMPIAPTGTLIKPTLIPLLAAQGCVHPLVHRRVRVSIIAVGDQWVRPDESPTMNRERNTANAALVALTLGTAAMPHDFQAVAGPAIRPALDRALTNTIVVILGAPSRPLARALDLMGVEPVVPRIAIAGVGRFRYSTLVDVDGRVANHVFRLPADPVAASIGFQLLVRPLIARLQGDLAPPTGTAVPLAAGSTLAATNHRACVRPANRRVALDGQVTVAPIIAPRDDLVAWAEADGLLVLPEHAGPWNPGDLVEYLPIPMESRG